MFAENVNDTSIKPIKFEIIFPAEIDRCQIITSKKVLLKIACKNYLKPSPRKQILYKLNRQQYSKICRLKSKLSIGKV